MHKEAKVFINWDRLCKTCKFCLKVHLKMRIESNYNFDTLIRIISNERGSCINSN